MFLRGRKARIHKRNPTLTLDRAGGGLRAYVFLHAIQSTRLKKLINHDQRESGSERPCSFASFLFHRRLGTMSKTREKNEFKSSKGK